MFFEGRPMGVSHYNKAIFSTRMRNASLIAMIHFKAQFKFSSLQLLSTTIVWNVKYHLLNQYATLNSDSGSSYFDGVIKIDSTCDKDAVDVELELFALGGGKAVSSTFSVSSSEASVLNVVTQLLIQLFLVPIRILEPLCKGFEYLSDKHVVGDGFLSKFVSEC